MTAALYEEEEEDEEEVLPVGELHVGTVCDFILLLDGYALHLVSS